MDLRVTDVSLVESVSLPVLWVKSLDVRMAMASGKVANVVSIRLRYLVSNIPKIGKDSFQSLVKFSASSSGSSHHRGLLRPSLSSAVLGRSRGALPSAAATAQHVVAGAAAPEEARHLGRLSHDLQHPRGNRKKIHGSSGNLFGTLLDAFGDFGDLDFGEKVERTRVFTVNKCSCHFVYLLDPPQTQRILGRSKELTSGSLHFKWQDLQSDSTRSSTAKRWIEAMHTHGVAMVSG